jgi:release factor glutamine methyltransferase
VTATVRSAIDDAAKRLAVANISDARAEARRLVALGIQCATEDILATPDLELSATAEERVESVVSRRVSHEPFAYISGEREFWSLPFRVSRATLIPRPDTETVVETALDYLHSRRISSPRILDLGCGSGCILLALLSELPEATGIGVDIGADACRVAEGNAATLGLAGRALFRVGNWVDGIRDSFDLIVSNPPYIPDGDIPKLEPDVALFEPRAALSGGPDGLNAYRALVKVAPPHLTENGALVFEVGADQSNAVADLLRGAGLDIVSVRADLGGIPRCVMATWPENQANPRFGR